MVRGPGVRPPFHPKNKTGHLRRPVTQNKFSWNAFLSIFRSLFSRIRSIMSRDPPDSPRSSQNKKPNHRSTTKNKFGWSTWLSILRSFFKCFSLSNDTPGSTQLPQHEKESSTITTSVLPVEKTDKYFCEYDSTWEDQSEEPVRRSPQSYRFNRFRCAARDMQKYRHDYPERTVSYYSSGQDEMPNLQFYLGQRTSSPDGVSIEDFHNEWRGDYSKLERVHSYIQWLFPLQEPGMNYQATELTKKEIQAFLSNNTARERLLESYKLMLDFYGIKLTNDTTGDVETAENWHQRFENLDRHSHNNLRITRILKCLGTLGFPHFQAPLVKFFLKQMLVEGRLDSVKESALNYFIFAVLDKQERRELVKYAYQHYEPEHEFVWCPMTIQNMFMEEEYSGDGNTSAMKQRDVNMAMNKFGMADETRDLMQLDEQSNSGGVTEVSKPQNNRPRLLSRQTGCRQAPDTKGGDRNTSCVSSDEHRLSGQKKDLDISNSIATEQLRKNNKVTDEFKGKRVDGNKKQEKTKKIFSHFHKSKKKKK